MFESSYHTKIKYPFKLSNNLETWTDKIVSTYINYEWHFTSITLTGRTRTLRNAVLTHSKYRISFIFIVKQKSIYSSVQKFQVDEIRKAQFLINIYDLKYVK